MAALTAPLRPETARCAALSFRCLSPGLGSIGWCRHSIITTGWSLPRAAIAERSARSARKRRARGVAKRNPRDRQPMDLEPAERTIADSRPTVSLVIDFVQITHLAIDNRQCVTAIARPRAGFKFLVLASPGVSLRSTPGFMPSCAPRTRCK